MQSRYSKWKWEKIASHRKPSATVTLTIGEDTLPSFTVIKEPSYISSVMSKLLA